MLDMNDKTLHANEWISLIDRDGYIFATETRSDGQVVAVLPFQRRGMGLPPMYCVRLERCPAWGDEFKPCAVTGTPEGGETLEESAARELLEETGFDVQPQDLVALGTCHASKGMDTVYHLYGADVTDLEEGEIIGDGSPGEEGATTTWIVNVAEVVDPLVPMMAARL